MDADLEAPARQLPQKSGIDSVPRPEVERRAEAELLLDVGQGEREWQPLLALDVVRENDGRSEGCRPEPPEGRLRSPLREQHAERVEANEARDAQVDRPLRKPREALPPDQQAPRLHLR